MITKDTIINQLHAEVNEASSIKKKITDQIILFPSVLNDEEAKKILEGLNASNKNLTEKIFNMLHKEVLVASERARFKFKNVPLENEDFLTEGWISFKEALIKYNPKKSDRGFSRYCLDVVYWRSMDYIRKFLTNKYKTVNLAITKPVPTLNSYEYDVIDLAQHNPWEHYEAVGVISDFMKVAEKKDKEILEFFFEGTSMEAIAAYLNCTLRASKRKLKLALDKLKRKLA